MHVKERYGIPMPRTIAAAILAATFAASTALAAVPATDDIAFGARPGNVIGTGNSLPASVYASNITEANTHSRIAPRLPQPQTVSGSPHALLSAASRALDAGRTGEAQEALERAEYAPAQPVRVARADRSPECGSAGVAHRRSAARTCRGRSCACVAAGRGQPAAWWHGCARLTRSEGRRDPEVVVIPPREPEPVGAEADAALAAAGHVLAVEDDAGMRRLITRILQENGFRVTGARNGHEMWEALERLPIDLVLLDVMLPGTSGMQSVAHCAGGAAFPSSS